MRNKFIDFLIKEKKLGSDIVLLVGDLGFSVVEPFSDLFPDSFINVGVAEQNMAGIAAGIASEGKKVFTYSIGNFNTYRCAEQLRNDIDYHNFSVCTVSVGGGVAYGNMGYSHHAVQDFSLMRSMPNTLICAPCDPLETELCLNLILKRSKPSYLRLHKAGEPIINISKELIKPGEPRFIAGNKSAKNLILTTGFVAQKIYKRVTNSEKFCLYSMPAWGQKFREFLRNAPWIKSFETIYTVEDHLLDGGFTSWLLECLISLDNPPKIIPKTLSENVIGLVAKEDTIHQAAKLYDIEGLS